jgi:hypothetical protein
MDAERKQRLARNETVFREVNERIEELTREGGKSELPGATPDLLDALCECGNRDCTELLRITISEYERVRQEPTHFLVAPGHAIPDIEEVVETEQQFQIVRKLAGEGDLARTTDPRS